MLAPTAARKVLYVRLPVWKIWPGSLIYLADFIHKERPNVEQRILDLALIPAGQRQEALCQAIDAIQPDVVAFSWRNMQTFGPHPENDALDVVMNYDHSPHLLRKLKAAFDALRIIRDYALSRMRNFGYMRLARQRLPHARLVVGGPAVSIFARHIARHCPSNTVVAVGEGEQTLLAVVDGLIHEAGHHYVKSQDGSVEHYPAEENFDLSRLTAVNFPYIESIFPEFGQFLDGDVGVHTKRGCPFQCHFCIYNRIEGKRQRYRDPFEIGKELASLYHRYGVRKIWFTDAQFCSTRRSMRHVEAILDQMIARDIQVRWTGYVRLNYLTPDIARKMLTTGLSSIDLSFTGTQDVADRLTLGLDIEQQMEALRMFKTAGHTDQKIKLYMPLNAPGETVDTLRATLARVKTLYALFGREQVLPFIFFVGVQPGSRIEKELMTNGYLPAQYNPLTLNPFLIKKLLYNPKPLGTLIGKAYLEALDRLADKSEEGNGEYIGRLTLDILDHHLAQLPQRRRRARIIPLFQPENVRP
jgi:radical SAM superfamily enzyme YgiQ (UPF0313 family)